MPFLIIGLSSDGRIYGTASPARDDLDRTLEHAEACLHQRQTRTVFVYEARIMAPEFDHARRARERRRWLHPWLEPFGDPLATLGDRVSVPDWIQEVVDGKNPTS